MKGLPEKIPVGIEHIFHPTDLSPPSMTAFAHALKLSLGLGADLTIMHVDPQHADHDFEEFPHVRATLANWGILTQGATKQDLLQLNFNVQKILARTEDPVASVVQLLWRKPADLMVLSTHEKDHFVQWLHHPTAETGTRKSRIMTLFVPSTSSGFISLDRGACRLRRVLIPIDHRPHPQPAVEAACTIAAAVGAHDVSFELLHVGSEKNMPAVVTPWRNGWTWSRSFASGIVVDEVLAMVARSAADLIVMGTEWRHGFLDALLGSTTERVLRQTPCPLLAVPVGEPLKQSFRLSEIP